MVKTDLKSKFPAWTSDDGKLEELQNKNLIPKGYFELFFDDEVLNLIVDETNRYASQKNRNLNVDKHEMKCLLQQDEYFTGKMLATRITTLLLLLL